MKRRESSTTRKPSGGRTRRWMGLGVALGAMWVMVYVVLPWGQNLPFVRPVMQIIADADIDAGTYFYTQSEETAQAQMFVRNTMRTPQ
jgi:hypothetical protein